MCTCHRDGWNRTRIQGVAHMDWVVWKISVGIWAEDGRAARTGWQRLSRDEASTWGGIGDIQTGGRKMEDKMVPCHTRSSPMMANEGMQALHDQASRLMWHKNGKWWMENPRDMELTENESEQRLKVAAFVWFSLKPHERACSKRHKAHCLPGPNTGDRAWNPDTEETGTVTKSSTQPVSIHSHQQESTWRPTLNKCS